MLQFAATRLTHSRRKHGHRKQKRGRCRHAVASARASVFVASPMPPRSESHLICTALIFVASSASGHYLRRLQHNHLSVPCWWEHMRVRVTFSTVVIAGNNISTNPACERRKLWLKLEKSRNTNLIRVLKPARLRPSVTCSNNVATA